MSDKKGFEIADDIKNYLGAILEATEKLHSNLSNTEGIENAVSEMTYSMKMPFILLKKDRAAQN